MEKQTVSLLIDKEEDIYCPFNNDHELNEEVTDYLIRKFVEGKTGNGILVRILSKEKVDESQVRDAFDKWIELANNQMKNEYRRNMTKQGLMIVIGIGFIILSLLLQDRVNAVIFTVLSTISAFAMWESAAIWIVENPKLRIQARMIGK